MGGRKGEKNVIAKRFALPSYYPFRRTYSPQNEMRCLCDLDDELIDMKHSTALQTSCTFLKLSSVKWQKSSTQDWIYFVKFKNIFISIVNKFTWYCPFLNQRR